MAGARSMVLFSFVLAASSQGAHAQNRMWHLRTARQGAAHNKQAHLRSAVGLLLRAQGHRLSARRTLKRFAKNLRQAKAWLRSEGYEPHAPVVPYTRHVQAEQVLLKLAERHLRKGGGPTGVRRALKRRIKELELKRDRPLKAALGADALGVSLYPGLQGETRSRRIGINVDAVTSKRLFRDVFAHESAHQHRAPLEARLEQAVAPFSKLGARLLQQPPEVQKRAQRVSALHTRVVLDDEPRAHGRTELLRGRKGLSHSFAIRSPLDYGSGAAGPINSTSFEKYFRGLVQYINSHRQKNPALTSQYLEGYAAALSYRIEWAENATPEMVARMPSATTWSRVAAGWRTLLSRIGQPLRRIDSPSRAWRAGYNDCRHGLDPKTSLMKLLR